MVVRTVTSGGQECGDMATEVAGACYGKKDGRDAVVLTEAVVSDRQK